MIFGSGGVGSNAVQGARFAGAKNVVVVDPVEFKREMATTVFGATHAFATAKEAHEFVVETTWGQLADHVIMTPGAVTEEMVQAAVMMRTQAGMLTEADIAAAPSDPPDVGDLASATMIYTSGTTGKPKGAFRSGAPDPEVFAALLNLFAYRPDDIYLTSGPLYHSGPSAFLRAAQLYGQTMIVQRGARRRGLAAAGGHLPASSTFAAPAVMRMICALPKEVKARYDRSSMRVMIANAAPWSYELKKRYMADFPPGSLFPEIYGSTELGVNTVLLPEDQLRKPGSCGKAARDRDHAGRRRRQPHRRYRA